MRVHLENVDPQESAPHLTMGDQLTHDLVGQVDGDGEADPLITSRARDDGGIDADQLPRRVDEGSPGVARVDGGIGLDVILVVGETGATPSQGADDPGGTQRFEAERRCFESQPKAAVLTISWPPSKIVTRAFFDRALKRGRFFP